METREVYSRRCILRVYGTVSLLQLLLGVLLIVAGLLAIRYQEDPVDIFRPPYFLCSFLVGMLMISGGVCTLYIYLTEAPCIDFYFLEAVSIRRIHQSVIGNTAASVLSFLFCLLGIFICVVFAVGPCDTPDWLARCSFYVNRFEHRLLALLVTSLMAASFLVTSYSSIMSCVHGWVFDFEVLNIKREGVVISDKARERANSKSSVKQQPTRPVSGFQPVNVFEIEDQYSDDEQLNIGSNYSATSSFRQTGDRKFQNDHDVMRHHVTSQQQTPNYVAVLNDPAMKQKLKERNSRLQEL